MQIKLGLFAVMLLIAAANRFILTPRLREQLELGADNCGISVALSALKTSILVEIGFAVLVLLVVGVLGTLAPPISGK